uniref:Alpha 1,4-glycosyltransferase domain-containing protein n=1 Tax=Physcomitrium patens TaxID=3218 RepID=A0A7I4DVH9_PHYPA
MPRPRHLGPSPSLNRSLSRLSSSSSFPSRHSNSRIYTFLIVVGLLLFAVVAFLQACLIGAPQGSKLSPLEHTKSGAGVGAEQAWWKENSRAGNNAVLDPGTGKVRAVEKSKLGRKMGAVQGVEDGEKGESGDEEIEDGDEMGDDEDEDEDAGQDRLDIDVDDRIVEEEGDSDLAVALIVDEEFQTGENEPDSSKKSGQAVVNSKISAVSAKRGVEKVAFVKSLGSGRVNSENSTNPTNEVRSKSTRHESKQDNMAKVNGVPDWVLDGKLRSRQDIIADTLHKGFGKGLGVDVEKRKSSFFWDHAVGVRKRSLENVDSFSTGETKNSTVIVKSGRILDDKHADAEDKDAAKVAVLQLRGYKEVVENWKERFNSDDELIDDDVQRRLEGVRVIEDALLLNEDGLLDKPIPSKKLGAHLKKGRSAFDPIDPVNNPMLQDPDTTPGTWMTKTDNDMLRAIRGDRFSDGLQPKVLLRGNLPATVTVADFEVGRRASAVEASSDSMQEKEENRKPVLAVNSDLASHENLMGVSGAGKSLELSSESNADEMQWGYYPGIGSLSFSKFMEDFLGQERCSLNVFMAWTTPAWGFTARHQRVLESLFRFHIDACVVVFSDTFEFNFFSTFLKEGYKVAVVRPNVQELFVDTPSHILTASLPKWKENPLFHLHFTELLRLAALYKFGGIYLDMDMLVSRPLNSLHNTVGSEITVTGESRLNGAVLIFEKSRSAWRNSRRPMMRRYLNIMERIY